MNEYDSSRISDLMGSDQNYEMASCEEEADVLLLNTCSIRERAQEKVFHQLGRWRLLKNENPDLVIGVGGCVASQEGQNIKKRAHYVDLVFGPQTIHRVPTMVAEAKSNRLSVVDVTFPELEKFDCLPEPGLSGPSAFVSIMEGCSKYCSFCVVPYTRGEEISRSVESVMEEVVSVSKKGAKEIHLLGQNVNSYQGDFNGDKIRLSELLYYISELPEIGRIRYTTSHPMEFTDDLVEAYRDLPKLVDHLHLPVQAGSNAVLSAMKRGHTVEAYKEKISRLREIRPDISLSSDFIVGIPGETRADFEKTLELIGVGYKVSLQGNVLNLSLGYSHSIYFEIPNELKVNVESVKGKPPIIKLSGIDKQLIGQIAAKIKSLRPTEPYKGKGIKEQGQYVLRKEGKKK